MTSTVTTAYSLNDRVDNDLGLLYLHFPVELQCLHPRTTAVQAGLVTFVGCLVLAKTGVA